MDDRFDFARPFTLVGGFHALLKQTELNQWRDFCDASEVFKHFVKTHQAVRFAELKAHTEPLDEAALQVLIDAAAAAESACFDMAKAWYAGLVANDKKRVEA